MINEDGNVWDACFLATVASLMNTRLPEVSISQGNKIKVNTSKLRNLNVHHIPVCISFYFLEGLSHTKPLVDANSKEEKLAKSRLSICMNIFEDLCGMTTLGSLDIPPQFLMHCSKIALGLTKELTHRVREAFAKRNDKSVSMLDFSMSNTRKY